MKFKKIEKMDDIEMTVKTVYLQCVAVDMGGNVIELMFKGKSLGILKEEEIKKYIIIEEK